MQNKRKTGLFWLIALSLPLVFFIVLEMFLRGIGFGKSMPLFMENPADPQYIMPRPDVIKRYFQNDDAAPNVTIETNFFKKQKTADGIRIFVQGGSTAAGFPYGYGASIAGMLDYRLKQTFPNRDVEVINTALSAVNSYTILDFVDEIIAQKPDAVLIYAGHNEYLGVLGVGSTYTAANSHGATLMYLKLKDLRIFQLMQYVYSQFSQSSLHSSPASTARTVMAKVAKHKNIPVGSELFQQGLKQFESNLALVLTKYKKAGIPVFISTIASNLSAQPPFSSSPLTMKQQALLDEGVNDISADSINELARSVVENNSANVHYFLGQYYYSMQQNEKAKHHFEQAREHDLLRFRAPLGQNKTIRTLAKEFAAHLVEGERQLEKVARQGVIGKNEMIEHLHPTLKGYFVIADAFYQKLHSSKVIGEFVNPISRFQAQREIPLFAAEEYWGEAKIAGLMADFPFTQTPHAPKFAPIKNWQDKMGMAAYKKQVSWLDIATENLKQARVNKDTLTRIKAVKLLSDALPYNKQYAFQAGTELIRLERSNEAVRYLKRTLELAPNDTNAMLAMAHAYAQQAKLQLALNWLEQVKLREPNNATANEVIPQIKQAINAKSN